MDYTKFKLEELIKYIKDCLSADSTRKQQMAESLRYYDGKHDILNKERLTIGKKGKVQRIHNLPNSRIIDNQYATAVDKKVAYLFSKAPVVRCKEDKAYQKEIQNLYTMKFLRTLSKIALESYLCGISWMYVSANGERLTYQKMNTEEITPIWSDKNHESLSALIRSYSVSEFMGGKVKEVQRLDFYTRDEIYLFEVGNDDFKLLKKESYIKKGEKHYSFGKIPFIYFKSNSKETILLSRCKSLQDGINTILSNFQDNMLEDKRNTILVITNYDGQDLGEFRSNLAQYGAVKVRSEEKMKGGVETLEITVNAENYKTILEILKQKLIENVRSIDLKGDRTTQAPNELNIKAMYAEMELDANATELEYQASLEHLEWFYRKIKNLQPEELTATVAFRRNIMVNEESLVGMIKNSVGIVSKETLLASHPLVDDVEEELERITAEKEKEQSDIYDPFQKGVSYDK
ncbi:MAG: phage portal protein [Eubacteriales bacterium]|nr:phage portal protein [Eubacteriales bacterium]